MSTILRIDASSRIANSHSRAIGNLVEARLTEPGARVSRRDLSSAPLGHITDATIEAMFGVARKRMFGGATSATRLSDQVIDEVREAGAIIITTPMYNFGLPSALKAWIDQLVRVQKTFAYENGEFRGLLQSKPVYVVIAYGARGYADGALKPADFVRPYLDFVLRFIGLTDLHFITVEGTSGSEEAGAIARAEAVAQIGALFPELSRIAI